mgnify:FL=1
MKSQFRDLLPFLLFPLAVGAVSALLTAGSMEAFADLCLPPLSPPGWVFPVIWTFLYLLMGFAAFLVVNSGKCGNNALFFYLLQLFFNFMWSIWFFNCEWYLFSFFWLVALWLLIFATIRSFGIVSPAAANLMLPYLAWVTFAGYLNLGICFLN